MATAAARDRCRSPPLSLSDFQQLVSNAFDLHSDSSTQQRPSLAFRRAPTPLPRSSSSLSEMYTSTHDTPSCNITSLDSDTDDDQLTDIPVVSRPVTFLPSLSGDGPTDRSRTPFNLLKTLKTRASALLRPSAPDIHATVLSTTQTLSSRPSTARPSLSSQRTLQPLPTDADPFVTPLQITSIMPSRPCSPHSLNAQELRGAPSRPKERPLSKSFVKMSKRGLEPVPPLPLSPLDSFFDASALREGPGFPPYARPSASLPRPQQLLIHTRLPPLRKSRSFAPSLFSKKLRRSSSKLSDRPKLPRAKSSYGLELPCNTLEYAFGDPRCPSPFTCPRDPPELPNVDPIVVPDYAFQRRGSATSSCTMSSTKTTSTFSDRVSSAFSVPISFPFISKSRSHSKLHLFIASSTQSSPSSISTATTASSPPVTPLSPTFSFSGTSAPYSFPYSQGKAGYARSLHLDPNASRTSLHYLETAEDALAIGRVLTPEPDPFAKPEIELGWDRDHERDGTPRPMSSQFGKRHSGLGKKRHSARRSGGIGAGSPAELAPRIPEHVSCTVVSPTYSFPSSCSIHSAVTISDPSTLAVIKSTPPSPSKREQLPHPPSAWSPYSSPVMNGNEELPVDEEVVAAFPLPPLSGKTGILSTLKALPPRPPSRPLPCVPIMDEVDVFGVIPTTSTPQRIPHLRKERRSLSSLVARSPSSACTSISKSLPSRVPSQLPCRLSDGRSYAASMPNKLVADRPPSPFPLVRELSAGSQVHKANLSKELIIEEEDSGIDIGDGSGQSDDFDDGQDDSCVLSKEFLKSIALGRQIPSSPSSLPVVGTKEVAGVLDNRFDRPDHSSSSSSYSSIGLHLRSDTPISNEEPFREVAPSPTATADDEPEPDNWDQNTSRSTAFFSARSSLLTPSFIDSDGEDADEEVDEDITSRTFLADYSLKFSQTSEGGSAGMKAWI